MNIADPTVDLTGNDYVSLPRIGPDGSIHSVTALHSGMGGLLEWAGPGDAPLLDFDLTLNGTPLPLAGARARRLDRWIPTFTVSAADGSEVTITVCAPGGYPAARGFLVRVEANHRGRAPSELLIGVNVRWAHATLHVLSPRPAGRHDRAVPHEDRAHLLLSLDDGRGPTLAIGASHAARMTPDRIQLELPVPANSRAHAALFIGVGRERDAAVLAARALARAGADALLRQARLDLSLILRPAQDHRWGALLNRNLVFARYFATGRAIDDERVVLLRSRSPYALAPATCSDREMLFQILPALWLVDPPFAREALLRCFELHGDRSGDLLHAIDGHALDSGFVLEHLLLYPHALDRYMTETGDVAIGEDPLALQILVEADAAVWPRLHPEVLLAAGELLPSGDRLDRDYPLMGNVLLQAFAAAVDRIAVTGVTTAGLRVAGAAHEVAAALWQHLLAFVEGEPLLASSASLEGDTAVYDDPAFSIALVPFLGFCAEDDPAWRDTLTFLRSSRYPLWREGAVPGLATRSDPERARLTALCADLLGPFRDDALDRLLRLRFPAEVAAGCWDPADGTVAEPYDAAASALLAWTLARLGPRRAVPHPG